MGSLFASEFHIISDREGPKGLSTGHPLMGYHNWCHTITQPVELCRLIRRALLPSVVVGGAKGLQVDISTEAILVAVDLVGLLRLNVLEVHTLGSHAQLVVDVCCHNATDVGVVPWDLHLPHLSWDPGDLQASNCKLRVESTVVGEPSGSSRVESEAHQSRWSSQSVGRLLPSYRDFPQFIHSRSVSNNLLRMMNLHAGVHPPDGLGRVKVLTTPVVTAIPLGNSTALPTAVLSWYLSPFVSLLSQNESCTTFRHYKIKFN